MNLPRNDFQKKPLDVLEGLKQFLGESGFPIVERAILQNVRETFRIREGKGLGIFQIIELAKKNYLES